MKIVFCLDNCIIPGLHVSALSILKSWQGKDPPEFVVASADLKPYDIELLRKTLSKTKKPFELDFLKISEDKFTGFPTLNNSLATYYRLILPGFLDCDTYLYLDVDTLCQISLHQLENFDLGESPAAMVAEMPIRICIDEFVKSRLRHKGSSYHYNCGLMLVNRNLWLEEQITEQCITIINEERPPFWDQSALNFILVGRIATLNSHFNFRANTRDNWNCLLDKKQNNYLLHFVDYPKPWMRAGRYFHMMGPLWWSVYSQTAHYDEGLVVEDQMGSLFSSERRKKTLKAIRDRMSFLALRFGLRQPKCSEGR